MKLKRMQFNLSTVVFGLALFALSLTAGLWLRRTLTERIATAPPKFKLGDSGHAPARRGFTPTSAIEFAAMRGDTRSLERCLEAASDKNYVNRPGIDGYTPLHAAAEHGQVSAVLYLVGRGARVNARLVTGETPLDLAESAGRAECASALRRLGGVPGPTSTPKSD